jgi:hypothetical protein
MRRLVSSLWAGVVDAGSHSTLARCSTVAPSAVDGRLRLASAPVVVAPREDSLRGTTDDSAHVHMDAMISSPG